MAIVKKAFQEISDKINPPKKKHNFMDGLKDWALSPGGIVTIIALIALVALVEYKTSKK